jgi:hypothetical protein
MRIAPGPLAAAAVLLGAPVLHAQAPKPGPEHEKLGYFVARWNSTGEEKAGPMGPGGPVTGTSSCEWYTGGFYLVCRSDGKTPRGEMHGMWFLGYSPERQRYTYYGIDNTGMGAEPAYGQLSGDTWTWEWDSPMGGQTVKGRYVITQSSADAYSWHWDIMQADGTWARMGEGTDTKAK